MPPAERKEEHCTRVFVSSRQKKRVSLWKEYVCVVYYYTTKGRVAFPPSSCLDDREKALFGRWRTS